MSKEVKKIFIVLGLFALAGGFYYNFQELWMAQNNLSVKTIGIVLSLCALITVSMVFLCSNLIKPHMIKKVCLSLLFIKFIVLISLFSLNCSGLNVLIKFLIMIDYAIDTEIYACIYPMLSSLCKDDKTYAKKDLTYCIFYNMGVVVTSLLLSVTIAKINIGYNFYCLCASILIFVAFLVLLSVKLKNKNESNVDNLLGKLVRKIKNDKISKVYLLFIICGQISYNCVLSLVVTLLTSTLGFTPKEASTIIVTMGIVSAILGVVVLAKLTFKNNYINLSIKYAVRASLYVLAVVFNSKLMFLISLMYPKIISESYSHITDAPYINRIEDIYQLAFCNLREMISYFGKSIGTLICGLALTISVRLNFIFAAIFAIGQAGFSFYGLKLRENEVVK